MPKWRVRVSSIVLCRGLIKSKARGFEYVQKTVRKAILGCSCHARFREPADHNPGFRQLHVLGLKGSGGLRLPPLRTARDLGYFVGQARHGHGQFPPKPPQQSLELGDCTRIGL